MYDRLFLSIKMFLEMVWVLQIINFNIHNEKNKKLINVFLLLVHCIIILNINNIYNLLILEHIINLSIIFTFFKKNKKKSIVAFSISYLIIMVVNFIDMKGILVKILTSITKRVIPQNYYMFIGVCFFIFIMAISRLFFNYIKKYNHIICKNMITTISIIISGFFLDMIIVNEINKNIYTVIIINKAMIINIFLFSIAIIYTTIKVDNKLDSMGELNNALEIKNNELRKIKHDYGAQISYLYGLYLLNRWDDFGKSLENIREKNKQVSNVVSIKNNENSIIYQALKPALDYGVHILLEESIESDQIDINEDVLFYILSVIRENSMKYMEYDGMMIVRVYRAFGNAVIEIEKSNTHARKRKLLSFIKEVYFNCIDGWEDIYRLNEIKSLIEENNGDIYVKNKYISTLISISIPIINVG